MPKRILSGIVVSSNLNKTIIVSVTRRVKHKLYKKIINRSKKYHVHDESNKFNKVTGFRLLKQNRFLN